MTLIDPLKPLFAPIQALQNLIEQFNNGCVSFQLKGNLLVVSHVVAQSSDGVAF